LLKITDIYRSFYQIFRLFDKKRQSPDKGISGVVIREQSAVFREKAG
jgi:hypothetical protein